MDDERSEYSYYDKKNKAIFLFLVLTYICNCLLGFALTTLKSDFLYANQGYICMYGPGISGLIAFYVYRNRSFDLGLRRCAPKHLLWGMAIPILYLTLTYSIYWIMPHNMPRFAYPSKTLSLAALLIDLFFAFGEELGWRGFFVFPTTAKFGYAKASIFVGLIWGLWHNPYSLINSYGRSGALFFLINTVSLSFVMSDLRLCSKSVWPAVLVHGFHNYFTFVFYEITFGTVENYPQSEPLFLCMCVQAFAAILFVFLHRKKRKQCLLELGYKM